MRLVECIIIFHVTYLCQALQNATQAPESLDGNHTVLRDALEGVPLVFQLAVKCSWTLRLPGNSSDPAAVTVALGGNATHVLAEQICQDLSCGGVHIVEKESLPPNTTCFQNCVYHSGRLQNCSQSAGGKCTVMTEVVCDQQAVRLADGADRCAGRVELRRNGDWGTVCDDQWDLRDAEVVCKQLGCGYALNVTGQGGFFPIGSGPIQRDELNCSGSEENLWDCPAAQDPHDCGHKEDAGVVCSEMKAVRLSGGLDRCSGKVEIHRNGSWGTVCDNCWDKDLASMVCSMLRCGASVQMYTQFDPPLTHNNGSLWFYHCTSAHRDLWQCKEFVNSAYLCKLSRAAGVICNGSRGFPVATTPESPASTTRWLTETTSSDHPDTHSMTTEQLICIALLALLLVSLTANVTLCCHCRRKRAFPLKQESFNPPSSDYETKTYHDAVGLIKVTAHPGQSDELPSNPRYLWTQLSSVDSPSVDTDYEQFDPQFDPNNDPSVLLSTFRNSRRYRTDTNPLMSNLHCLPEEAPAHRHDITQHSHEPTGYGQVSSHSNSKDTFDSSSTSSGEDYENITNAYVSVTPDPCQPAVNYSTNDSLKLNYSNDQLYSGPTRAQKPGEDNEPLYSEVSPDYKSSSSNDDYDDIDINE
ncbi:T-cell differentiation antigen CD6-like isoform X2 [Genypterus blacodes]|uniref:T-cell differentiation antigen CD6-like isoform X2 n=1 Tax=Genypterus blacodes TaxID=154954 RepID=UPI003F7680F7